MTHTESDLDIMARTLFGEAVAHNEADAIAIAHVIRNRLEYKRKAWGLTVQQVCQKPLQFSCWNGGDRNYERITTATYSNQWLMQCRQIAQDVLIDRIPDPTNCSTHYHTRAVAPKWSKGKAPVYETAGHLFFNDIDTKKPSFVKTKVVAASTALTTVALESTEQTHVTESIAPVVNEVMSNVHMVTPFLNDGLWKAVAGIAIVIIVMGGVWYFVKSRRG